jgi:hypothetical protein
MVALSSLGGGGSSGAGSPKEFINTTLTFADLVNDKEWNVVVNDADTVSVVEEIVIDTTVVPAPLTGTTTLFNGLTQISAGTVGLVGSEVVGRGQTLKYVLPEIPTAGALNFDGNQISYYRILDTTTAHVVKGSGVASKSGQNYPIQATDLELVQDYIDPSVTELSYSSENSVVPAMTQPSWFYETPTYAWYFKYDGNSTTRIYRSTKSNGNYGAWNEMYSNAYAYPALDMVNEKIYYRNNGPLYAIDMNTAAVTTVGTFSSPSSSSYSCSAFVNGIFFWIPSSSYSSNIWWVNVNDLTNGNFSHSSAATISNGMNFAVSYEPVNDEYHISIGPSSSPASIKYYLMPASLSGVSTYIGTLASKTPTALGNGIYHGDELGNFYLTNSSGKTGVVNYVGSAVGVYESGQVPQTLMSGTGWFRRKNGTPFSTTVNLPDAAISAGINLKLKVSGTTA